MEKNVVDKAWSSVSNPVTTILSLSALAGYEMRNAGAQYARLDQLIASANALAIDREKAMVLHYYKRAITDPCGLRAAIEGQRREMAKTSELVERHKAAASGFILFRLAKDLGRDSGTKSSDSARLVEQLEGTLAAQRERIALMQAALVYRDIANLMK